MAVGNSSNCSTGVWIRPGERTFAVLADRDSQKPRWISIPMNRTIVLPSLSRREAGKGCLSAGVRRWQARDGGSTSAARTILYDRRMPERRYTGPEAWHARVRDEIAVIISRSGLL